MVKSLQDFACVIAAGGALHPNMLLDAIKDLKCQREGWATAQEITIATLNKYPEGDHGYNPPMLVTMTSTAGTFLHRLSYTSCLGSHYLWEPNRGEQMTLGSGVGMGIHAASLYDCGGVIVIEREFDGVAERIEGVFPDEVLDFIDQNKVE